jgi:hypothetical protein
MLQPLWIAAAVAGEGIRADGTEPEPRRVPSGDRE